MVFEHRECIHLVVILLISISHVEACRVSVDNCVAYTFKDWTGERFDLDTTRKCTRCFKILFSDICYETSCTPTDLNIYDSAKAYLINQRGWNIERCFKSAEDLRCSGPEPEELVQKGLIQQAESETYDRYRSSVFSEGCKIHDMCYLNSDMKRRDCDDDFKHNMQQICKMKYPDAQTVAKKAHCMLWTQIFYTAVRLGGSGRAPIWSGNECMKM